MSKKKRSLPSTVSNVETHTFLEDVHGFVLTAGIEKARLQIFKTQLRKFGGLVNDAYDSDTTHVIVSETMDAERLLKLMKWNAIPENVKILKTTWLSSCFKEKSKADVTGHELDLSYLKKRKHSTSDEDEDTIKNAENKNEASNTTKPGRMWHYYKRPKTEDQTDTTLVSNKLQNSDSDYEPSDHEDNGDSDPNPTPGTSNNSTPNTSPHKALPVMT